MKDHQQQVGLDQSTRQRDEAQEVAGLAEASWAVADGSGKKAVVDPKDWE